MAKTSWLKRLWERVPFRDKIDDIGLAAILAKFFGKSDDEGWGVAISRFAQAFKGEDAYDAARILRTANPESRKLFEQARDLVEAGNHGLGRFDFPTIIGNLLTACRFENDDGTTLFHEIADERIERKGYSRTRSGQRIPVNKELGDNTGDETFRTFVNSFNPKNGDTPKTVLNYFKMMHRASLTDKFRERLGVLDDGETVKMHAKRIGLKLLLFFLWLVLLVTFGMLSSAQFMTQGKSFQALIFTILTIPFAAFLLKITGAFSGLDPDLRRLSRRQTIFYFLLLLLLLRLGGPHPELNGITGIILLATFYAPTVGTRLGGHGWKVAGGAAIILVLGWVRGAEALDAIQKSKGGQLTSDLTTWSANKLQPERVVTSSGEVVRCLPQTNEKLDGDWKQYVVECTQREDDSFGQHPSGVPNRKLTEAEGLEFWSTTKASAAEDKDDRDNGSSRTARAVRPSGLELCYAEGAPCSRATRVKESAYEINFRHAGAYFEGTKRLTDVEHGGITMEGEWQKNGKKGTWEAFGSDENSDLVGNLVGSTGESRYLKILRVNQ